MSLPGPLAGVTILDLTRVLAGPYATLLLADLGARVIKVERPGVGDDARRIGPFVAGRSAYFESVNRGKQSIALDLRDPGDREVFEKLLARSDVLVENFRPGALERLGYGWDTLHERFPRLVHAATSGFGQTGPYAQRPAYDLVVQALGGLMSVTGQPGGPPTRVGTSIGDLAAGLFTALGVAAALLHRERTGEAIQVDVAMLDCQVALLENALARLLATGETPGPLGARHPSITPFDAFRTADGHVVIAAGHDALFATACEVLGRAELARDPRFATNELRTRNEAALKAELEGALGRDSTQHWLAKLSAAGIPCAPIQNVAQVLADPQVAARNMIVELAEPGDAPRGAAGTEAGPPRLRTAGNPIKLSAFPDPPVRPPAPDLDADAKRIRSELG
ncbi:MAG TPA: CoA transferase [Myxococcota bacterium]|nr:CoA transferase [Myxococcota bacterium]